jgi:hypothetical protein
MDLNKYTQKSQEVTRDAINCVLQNHFRPELLR